MQRRVQFLSVGCQKTYLTDHLGGITVSQHHPYKFSEKYKIRHAIEFALVLKKGQRIGQKYLLGFYLNNSLNHFRLGISIGKKFGCSCERNYLKRMIREAFRISSFRQLQGIDLIILASKKYKTLDWKNIQNDLQNIMNKIIKTTSQTTTEDIPIKEELNIQQSNNLQNDMPSGDDSCKKY